MITGIQRRIHGRLSNLDIQRPQGTQNREERYEADHQNLYQDGTAAFWDWESYNLPEKEGSNGEVGDAADDGESDWAGEGDACLSTSAGEESEKDKYILWKSRGLDHHRTQRRWGCIIWRPEPS